MKRVSAFAAAIVLLVGTAASVAQSPPVCQSYGPQAPRDITQKGGTNPVQFPLAPAASSMNLCNIHFHKNAEHKGPGFAKAAGKGEAHGPGHGHGGGAGFQCNTAGALSAAELTAPATPVCKDLKPGDTIEVHWVYSSCAVAPGKGLAACSSASCANPTLRVESQVFLVVNNRAAWDFRRFDYAGAAVKGVHQTRSLPTATGQPVVFRGSTTGPDYTDQKCSPLQATWSVRPYCAKVDINSLGAWCAANAFSEDHGHGVRPLVTAPALLERIR